ncbi:MAG TPA: type II secretion system F family protein, partial [Rhodocyclaceae bacterium]|nr:type II secretion system F family protein [Rhodocyclaceae bacterium]
TVPTEALMLFSRQMHTLLKSGVPIMRALRGLQESAPDARLAEAVGEVRQSLESGRELASALARHPRVFSPFYVAMIRIGEVTGRLDEIFVRLFHHLEFDKYMRDQVKAALRYPSFVIAVMIIALLVVNIWVIPAFAKVYEGFDAQLPILTRVLVGVSAFVKNWWFLLIGGAAAMAFGFRAWVATAAGRLEWDRIKLRLPIMGKIILKATLARFARSFALAVRSGVPIVQALSVVANTVDNDHIASKIEGMRDGLERGESVLKGAIAAGIFTPVVLQMIAVGEESGSLDDLLDEVGVMYQREVEFELKTLSSQIEPILIVFLGILVLVMALGIFLPIWDLGRVAMKGNG